MAHPDIDRPQATAAEEPRMLQAARCNDALLVHSQLDSCWTEGLLRAVVENLPQTILVKDIDRRYIAANPAAVRRFHLAGADDLLGRTVHDLLPQELADDLAREDTVAIESGNPTTPKRRECVSEGGEAEWLETRTVPLKDAAGSVVALLTLARDVSAAAIAERALEKERSLLYAVMDAVPDYIFVKDRQGRYITVNQALYSVLGCASREEMIGTRDDDHHPKELAQRFKDDDERVMASGKQLISHEEPHIDAEGTHRWLSTSKAPLRDRQGNVEGIVGIARDITRRKEAEVQLGQTQKLESIGQLAAGIAHEINTPAQYATDNTRFIKESLDTLLDLVRLQERLMAESATRTLRPDEIEQLQEARSEADLDYLLEELPSSINESLDGLLRIASIVQSMKEFSHPDAQQMQFADINRAIQSTLTVATSEWKYVADVETDLDPYLPHVKCNLGSLNQVVLNLIVNAAHAISEVSCAGGEKKTIAISTRSLAHEIEIRVADNGPGMPPHVQERIFDPFFTTKQVGKGSGQGLALAHSVIVKQHGGSITVDSKPGEGTTFTVCIPFEYSPQDLYD